MPCLNVWPTMAAICLGFTISTNAQICPSFDYGLNSQEFVDRFPRNCEVVQGSIILRSYSDINDLSPLSKITAVGGSIYIEYLPFLTRLSGLDSLTSIGESLSINHNDLLMNLNGLAALRTVGGSVLINSNPVLENVDGLSSLTTIGGSLSIQRDSALTNLNGLSSLNVVGHNFRLIGNTSLEDVNGLASLTDIGWIAEIGGNGRLTNLDGLVSLTQVGGRMYVSGNANLSECCGLYPLISSGGVGSVLTMTDNHCDHWGGDDCGLDYGNCNHAGVYVLGCDGGYGQFERPTEGDLFLSGSRDSIIWRGRDIPFSVRLEYSSDLGRKYQLLDAEALSDGGTFYWDVPDDLATAKAKVRLAVHGTNDSLIVSDRFRIKPYVISRANASEDLELYDPLYDAWGFGNFASDVWPAGWWHRFDYQGGTDPFTGVPYDQTAGAGVFATAADSVYPDWISWVGAFGQSACYNREGNYRPRALLRWGAYRDSTFAGACLGISLSNALAFERKADFMNRYPSFPEFLYAADVNADDSIIPQTITELQAHAHGNPTLHHLISVGETRTPNETLADLRTMLSEDSTSIQTLTYFNNGPRGGGHAVVAYKLEQSQTDENVFSVWVYDSDQPNNVDARVTIDTSGAGGRGTWRPEHADTTWGGDRWLFLERPAAEYLQNAEFVSKRQSPTTAFDALVEIAEIYSNGSGSIVVTDVETKRQTGFSSAGLRIEIPGSVPLFPLTGKEGPPRGFILPAGRYAVMLSELSEGTVSASFFTEGQAFRYERESATSSQVDYLSFEGALKALNTDPDSKTMRLVSLESGPVEDRLLTAQGVTLVQGDSVKLENLPGGLRQLANYGSAKSYGITMEYVSDTERELFEHSGIDLAANTSHTLAPDWQDVGTAELVIYVDGGHDGSIEDTLTLENQSTAIDRQGPLDIPSVYRLDQNYPNPFNGTTTIAYALPRPDDVRLTVYDVLGRQIRDLASGIRPAGTYEASVDAIGLPSGVYFYRLRAGDYVETRRMVVVR